MDTLLTDFLSYSLAAGAVALVASHIALLIKMARLVDKVDEVLNLGQRVSRLEDRLNDDS